MKKLLLLILLVTTTYAENIQIADKICAKYFDKIIEHGWSDENTTLNAFIIKSETHAIPKILTHLQEPFIFEYDPKIPNYPIPKILVNKGEYKQLFAYVKYLEYKHLPEEVDKIYMDTLKGLNSIKPTQIMNLIFRMGNESILLKSIIETQNRYGLSQKLKNELKNSLLLDNQFLLKIIKKDNSFYDSVLTPFPKLKEKNQELYRYLVSSIKNNSLEKYKSYKKEKREEIRTFANLLKYTFLHGKEKFYTLLNIEPDTLEIDKFKLLNNIYEPRPKMLKTYQEYLTQVEENNKFLESLK